MGYATSLGIAREVNESLMQGGKGIIFFMITFRPMNLEADAADMACIYSTTTTEPISEQTARDWWTLREGQIRFTVLALDENDHAVGYWDVERET